MNTIIKSLEIFGIFLCTAFSCEKTSEDENFTTGRIIEITCGGTIIQFINTNQVIGEDWIDNFSVPVINYSNCALAGNLPQNKFEKGDTIVFNYKSKHSAEYILY